MLANDQSAEKQSPFKRFLASPFLLLIVMLIAVDVVVIYIQSQDKANQFQQNPRLVAIRQAIESDRRPDIVVLGDSLIYSALFFADDAQGLVKDRKQHFTYLEAKFLKQLLKKEFGDDIDILNLSMPGANPTDAHLLISELEARGKLPKLVLYGISPRAMVDNLVPTAGAIGGRLVLNVRPTGTATSGIAGACDKFVRTVSNFDPVANKIREYGQLGDTPGKEKLRDFFTGVVWNYYHDRAKIKSNFDAITLKALGRKDEQQQIALTTLAAPQPVKLERKRRSGKRTAFQVDPASFQRDLNNYQVRYNPPNFKKLESQSDQLFKCAEILKNNNSHFLVVSMPISEDNRNLIPDKLFKAYESTLNKIATEPGVTLVDLLTTREFDKASFLDSAHLNGSGATRLDQRLVSSIDKSWF
ncbi:MAG: hypothetical protein K2X93_24245 [Candidatus Obscuribacterales bacterium]|nr:hypothetical protein [Candidatus Obscuribacterales bacterium]